MKPAGEKPRRGGSMSVFPLEEIGLGVVTEKYDDELCKVIDNILDLNTDPKTIREINIKLKMKPDPENREKVSLEALVSSKLAPTKTYVSSVTVGIDRRSGEMAAIEQVAQQQELFPQGEKGGDNVTPISVAR